MISVKCPACGLVDWNVGNCKRCETPLEGLGAEEHGLGYFRRASEAAAQARSVRTARLVVLACLLVVLALTTLGALYEAHRPEKPQWFRSFYRHEPTVGEIFAHNLEVSGGADRLARLRSFRAAGRLTFKGGEAERAAASAGGQVTFILHAKAPDKIETQIEVGPPAEAATPAEPEETSDEPPTAFTSYSPDETPAPHAPQLRLSLRRGFDGSRGWEFVERTVFDEGSNVPVKESTTRELNGGELSRLKRYAQATGLARLAEGYTSLRLAGREPATWATGGGALVADRELPDKALRGHEAYVVSGVNSEGRDETLYFDTQTGLLLRVDFEAEDEEGEAVRVACAFSDYREVGGIKLPHRLRFEWGEESMTLTFDKYLPNEFIPDSTFEMPEAAD